MVISGFPALKDRLQNLPPKAAVVAAAHDEHTLQAVFAARRDGLIRPILVGRREDILSIVRGLGEALDPAQVVDAADDAACAAQSVALIRSGAGTMLIKGMLPTGTLLKAVVHKETGIRASQVMSHVAILDVPSYHKLLYITDGGMVVAPDLEQKRHILQNAVDFCRFLGYDCPKAAALCAVETVSPTMPETADGAALKAAGARGEFGPCLVEGPISLDLALDKSSAAIKGYESPVCGETDILLVPTMAAGNMMVKSLLTFAGAKMVGVVTGARCPIALNSRSASFEEKYNSLLACALAGGQ